MPTLVISDASLDTVSNISQLIRGVEEQGSSADFESDYVDAESSLSLRKLMNQSTWLFWKKMLKAGATKFDVNVDNDDIPLFL